MILPIQQLPRNTQLLADLCIVGSGAAGLALASEFLGTPWRVLVLESGCMERTQLGEELNVAHSDGMPHTGACDGRARVFGGTTTLWGGQLMTLRNSELAQRPWVPHSGWPLQLDDLQSYYARADRLMGIEPQQTGEDIWQQLGIPAPDLDKSKFITRFSQWAPLVKRNLALSLRGTLSRSPNVEIFPGATVTRIVANDLRNWVHELEITGPDRTPYTVRATRYVLCTGGIETPRLLLNSRLANNSTAVGRYFQDHISYVAGEFDAQSRDRVRQLFEPRYRGRCMYTPKIEPTDAMQQSAGLLNVMGHVKFDIPEALGLLEVKQMLKAIQEGRSPVPSVHAMLAMMRGGAELSRMAYSRVVHARRSAPSRGSVFLIVDVEQAPNPDSRITLSEDCDSLGMPRARVNWRLSGSEMNTLDHFTHQLQKEFGRIGLGVLKRASAPDFQLKEGLSSARDIYHHMGSTRMSTSARTGVVDPNLRCHDVHNLFIAGASTFPAGGIANPTLTIMALALRLADHLKVTLPVPVSLCDTAAA